MTALKPKPIFYTLEDIDDPGGPKGYSLPWLEIRISLSGDDCLKYNLNRASGGAIIVRFEKLRTDERGEEKYDYEVNPEDTLIVRNPVPGVHLALRKFVRCLERATDSVWGDGLDRVKKGEILHALALTGWQEF